MDQKHFQIYRQPNDLPAGLENLQQAWTEVAGQQELRMIALPVDSAGQAAAAKLRHDLKGSLRTLNLFLDSLKEGYRFDDAAAAAKQAALSKAVGILDHHLVDLLEIFSEG